MPELPQGFVLDSTLPPGFVLDPEPVEKRITLPVPVEEIPIPTPEEFAGQAPLFGAQDIGKPRGGPDDLKVINNWIQDNFTGRIESLDELREKDAVGKGVALNAARAAARVGPIIAGGLVAGPLGAAVGAIPFGLELMQAISEDPAGTTKDLLLYAPKTLKHLNTLTHPLVRADQEKFKDEIEEARQHFAADPLSPIFAAGILRGVTKAGFRATDAKSALKLEQTEPSPLYEPPKPEKAGVSVEPATAKQTAAGVEITPLVEIPVETVRVPGRQAPKIEFEATHTKAARPKTPVEEAFDKQRLDVIEQNKVTPKKVKSAMRRAIWDVSGGAVEKLLETGSKAGKVAVDNMRRTAGATAKAEFDYKNAEKRIYKFKKTADEHLFNDYIQARRTIEIEDVINPRRVLQKKEPIASPTGLSALEVRHQVEMWKRDRADIWPDILRAEKEYYSELQSLLEQKRDAGLINQTQFENLSDLRYSPRLFIQHMDSPAQLGGKTLDVRTSGIKALEQGSSQSLVNDTRLLLSQALSRGQGRIFNNRANQSLLKYVEENPENGFIKIVNPDIKVPGGKTKIEVLVDGERRAMLADNSFAQDWVLRDPEIKAGFANGIRIASGAPILRFFATGGGNPAFFVTNIPRDIALQWMSTTEYSAHLPYAIGQYARDLGSVAKDAFLRKGDYIDYINEGGGMEFLTHQGRLTSRSQSRVLGTLDPKLRLLREAMEYTGNTSEILTRLSLRRRAIRNGRTPAEATIIARGYLDFSQGGSWIKAIDNGMPYLNASIQGTRSILRGAKENPGVFAYKAAQISALSTGIYLANKAINPEALDDVPDRIKVSNWIITTPWSFVDENGDRRYLYVSVAKDQGQRVISSVAEAIIEKQIDGKLPYKQMLNALEDFLPLLPGDLMPPTLSAVWGYAQNRDFWYNKDIWQGPDVLPSREFTSRTPEGFIAAGKATESLGEFGISPARLQFALGEIFTRRNIYTDMVGGAWKAVSGEVSEKDNKIFIDELRKAPFARRLFRITSPQQKLRGEMKRITIEENTKRLDQNREIRRIIDLPDRKSGDIGEYVRTQSLGDRKRLLRRAQRVIKTPNLPGWFYDMAELPVDSRATMFYSVYAKASPEERISLLEKARGLSGFATKEFMLKFLKLKNEVEHLQ